VNDSLIPGLSKATEAGSHWQYDNADLVIYVEEKVVHFNLSRFPEIHVFLLENVASVRGRASGAAERSVGS
jgi:hypothetical protein